MQSLLSKKPERRRYFRIEDTVGLSYRNLTLEEAKNIMTDGVSRANESVYTLMQLQNKIEEFQKEFSLSEKGKTYQMMDLINRKVNILLEEVFDQKAINNIEIFELKEVNLSASGIAFNVPGYLELGGYMYLEMQLKPTNIKVATLAQIIACDILAQSINKDNYRLRIDYEPYITEEDREKMIQHIVVKQSKQPRPPSDERKINPNLI